MSAGTVSPLPPFDYLASMEPRACTPPPISEAELAEIHHKVTMTPNRKELLEKKRQILSSSIAHLATPGRNRKRRFKERAVTPVGDRPSTPTCLPKPPKIPRTPEEVRRTQNLMEAILLQSPDRPRLPLHPPVLFDDSATGVFAPPPQAPSFPPTAPKLPTSSARLFPPLDESLPSSGARLRLEMPDKSDIVMAEGDEEPVSPRLPFARFAAPQEKPLYVPPSRRADAAPGLPPTGKYVPPGRRADAATGLPLSGKYVPPGRRADAAPGLPPTGKYVPPQGLSSIAGPTLENPAASAEEPPTKVRAWRPKRARRALPATLPPPITPPSFSELVDMIPATTTWKDLKGKTTSEGSGFARTLNISIGFEDYKLWCKPTRSCVRTLIAATASQLLGDETVSPTTLHKLADGAIVTVQQNTSGVSQLLEENLVFIMREGLDTPRLSTAFFNALALRFFDDNFYNRGYQRGGPQFKTVDVEACLAETPLVTEYLDGLGYVKRPGFLTALLSFFFAQKAADGTPLLHTPVDPEAKAALLAKIGSPAEFIAKTRREVEETLRKVGMTEFRYEEYVPFTDPETGETSLKTEIRTQPIAEKLDRLFGYYGTRLSALMATITAPTASYFDLLMSVEPLYGRILQIGNFFEQDPKQVIHETTGGFEDTATTLENYKASLETFMREQPLKIAMATKLLEQFPKIQAQCDMGNTSLIEHQGALASVLSSLLKLNSPRGVTFFSQITDERTPLLNEIISPEDRATIRSQMGELDDTGKPTKFIAQVQIELSKRGIVLQRHHEEKLASILTIIDDPSTTYFSLLEHIEPVFANLLQFELFARSSSIREACYTVMTPFTDTEASLKALTEFKRKLEIFIHEQSPKLATGERIFEVLAEAQTIYEAESKLPHPEDITRFVEEPTIPPDVLWKR